MADYIQEGIIIIDSAEKRLADFIQKTQLSLYDAITKIFENVNISNGKLSSSEKTSNFLLSLQSRINKALQDSGYQSEVTKFLTNFPKIAENVKTLQEDFNGINITSKQIAPFQRLEVQATVERLLGSGVNTNFVQPIRQGLYRNILFGGTVGDAESLIKNFVITNKNGDSKLLRYVKQVSRDSLSQFDGGLQQKIAHELNLTAIRYVGSLILDSRAQCGKWTSQGLIALDDNFAQDIEDAINNKLHFEVGGKMKTSAGMIPGTDLITIMANRGGYNCRHRAIPTFKKK